MKVSFVDFWINFSEDNLFLNLLKNMYEDISVVKPNKADVIFFSCFGKENKKRKYKNTKKIFYLGENHNLYDYDFDYSLSFNEESFGGKNLRFPNWYLYFDWFEENKKLQEDQWLIPLSYLHNGSPYYSTKKTGFCSIVYSKPFIEREIYTNLISKYKEVEIYGSLPGFRKIGLGQKAKLDELSKYKFSLAMENTILSGYHTEKLLQAKLGGTIPLYFGSDTVSLDFNKESFIHINEYDDENLIEIIKEINEDDKKYENLRCQSLFNKDLNLKFLEKFFMKIL
jgi:hypothetical protein